MISLEEARELANEYLKSVNCRVRKIVGEVSNKFLVIIENERGNIPPGGVDLTVNKETGECRHEFLPREGKLPWSPIKGYKKLE